MKYAPLLIVGLLACGPEHELVGRWLVSVDSTIWTFESKGQALSETIGNSMRPLGLWEARGDTLCLGFGRVFLSKELDKSKVICLEFWVTLVGEERFLFLMGHGESDSVTLRYLGPVGQRQLLQLPTLPSGN